MKPTDRPAEPHIPPKPEDLEHDIQTCFQLMQTMDTLYEEYARKHGLTYMSLYILETLYELPGCTQKDISDHTLYPKQTVNMVIRSFEEKGWVALTPNPADRRTKHVELTDSGLALARQIITPYWQAGHAAFGALDEATRRALLQGLASFTETFSRRVRQLD